MFFSTAHRKTYLSLVERNLGDSGVRVLAYCLMSNHVHWVVVPERVDSLAVLFRRVHGGHAQAMNAFGEEAFVAQMEEHFQRQ